MIHDGHCTRRLSQLHLHCLQIAHCSDADSFLGFLTCILLSIPTYYMLLEHHCLCSMTCWWKCSFYSVKTTSSSAATIMWSALCTGDGLLTAGCTDPVLQSWMMNSSSTPSLHCQIIQIVSHMLDCNRKAMHGLAVSQLTCMKSYANMLTLNTAMCICFQKNALYWSVGSHLCPGDTQVILWHCRSNWWLQAVWVQAVWPTQIGSPYIWICKHIMYAKRCTVHFAQSHVDDHWPVRFVMM